MGKSARDPSVEPDLGKAAAAVAVGQNIPVSVSLLYEPVPSVIGKGCHISFPVRKLCKVPRTVILRPCGAAAGVGNGSQMVFLIIGITGPDPRPFLFCVIVNKKVPLLSEKIPHLFLRLYRWGIPTDKNPVI